MPRRTTGLVAWLQRPSVIAGVALGLGATFLLRWRSEPRHEGPRIAEPSGYWARQGFVEMTPPIALPTPADGSLLASVWLKIPEGARIGVEERRGRVALRQPAGAEAVRVEQVGFRAETGERAVGDVRGTRFLPGGRELFYVYRPEKELGGSLVGFEWHRESAEEEASATQALLAWVARTAPETRRDHLVERTRLNNQCARCHEPHRPDNRRPREHGEVNRGTDASGLFLIQTVLADEAPLESYSARNPALESRFVAVHCGGRPAVISTDSPPRAHCENGELPRATFDLRAALAAGDERARAVCASRRYLGERMDERARAEFARALSDCRLAPR